MTQFLTFTNPHYLRAWNRLFPWVRSLVCPNRVSGRGVGGGDPNPHFCSFFINILHPTIFFMVFLNSFWGFQKQYYKTKLSNKAHSIVWFVRRHRLMCTWLISICCSNVWFPEFPIYRRKKSCTLCPNFGESCCLGWTDILHFSNSNTVFWSNPRSRKYRFQILLWETTKTHLKN